nr:hypothetical protein [Tanacetum cinerariifolium]
MRDSGRERDKDRIYGSIFVPNILIIAGSKRRVSYLKGLESLHWLRAATQKHMKTVNVHGEPKQ